MVSNKTISFVAAGGMTFLSFAAFAVLTQPAAKAEPGSHSANASVIVAPSCSMTTTTVAPHTATILNGNRTINIGKTTLEAFCNDTGGFAIYAAGYTGNIYSDNRLVSPNSTSTPDVINSGNTATGNTSSWGVKASVTEGTTYPAVIASDFVSAENDGYVEIPDEFALLASRNSVTSKSAGSGLDITYGAYVSPSQAAGTYTGQVIYLMVHPANASAPGGIPGSFDAAFADAGKTKLNGYYKMQDMSTSICSAVTTPTAADYSDTQEVQLIDNRDNNVYWVAKLKDGHCWMTQNLDHDIVTTAGYYTPENTDISAAWTPERATIKTIASDGSFTGWTNDSSNPYSADPGEWYFTDTYYNNACNSNPWCRYTNPSADATTLEKFSRTPFLKNGKHGHVGNFYNWTAAIASNDSSAYASSTMANVANSPQTSICPAGWRLPTISSVGANDEFTNLLTFYGAYPVADATQADKALLASPLYFVRAGLVNNGVLNYGGRHGYFWSSTVESGTNARYLYYRYASISPQNNGSRLYGFSLRCLAR